jgi:hypothetical protein
MPRAGALSEGLFLNGLLFNYLRGVERLHRRVQDIQVICSFWQMRKVYCDLALRADA